MSRTRENLIVFLTCWLVSFILYFPAARAGMVGDFPYYVDLLKKVDLWAYISPPRPLVLYQAMELHMYLMYHLFGLNPWPWHIVYISLHALNGLFLFLLSRSVLTDSGLKDVKMISATATVLFIICPNASEAVVWEPANHFLFVPATLMAIMIIIINFFHQQRLWQPVVAAILFFYSSFSLEYFYLLPWMALMIICYYRFALGYSPAIYKKALLRFFIPLLALFFLHLLLLRLVCGTFVSHYGDFSPGSIFRYLDKPLKYLFHILFFGRFMGDTRQKIYVWCESKPLILSFYGMLLCVWGYSLMRIKDVHARLKAFSLFSGLAMVTLAFLSLLIFANLFLITLDRYTYFSNGFIFISVALMLAMVLPRVPFLIFFCVYALLNLFMTYKLNALWHDSNKITEHLMNDFPDPGSKTVLLLNLPDNLGGAPMISAQPEGRFRIMKNTLTSRPISNTVYDVMAYNMVSPGDGAHVQVMNDSTVNVTLNQWGTWWLYTMMGGYSYETGDYKVDVKDPGHWYQLTIKKNNTCYMLLYQVGDQWKIVDWNKKDSPQN